jgi:sulfite dehydrogenase (cytochrome) subunit A
VRFLHYTFAVLLILLLSCQDKSADNSSVSKEDHEADSIENQMVTAPGKKPLRLLSDRPPNLETPLKYFLYDLTPNDVFFVRWHLSGLPTAIGEDTFRLRIGGNVNRTLSLSMNDLRTKFQPYSVTALCCCSGNARSCFKPRVPGAQWVNGGMGNAKWTGVKLKDILALAGAKSNSRFVSFNGLDAPPLSSTPDFVKSLEYPHAIDGEVMIAYEMNDAPIPLLNGFPLKLVVPGWYATYWVGMLSEVRVYADSFKGYWMDKAYLKPKNAVNGNENPKALATKMEPVTKMVVRSIFVSPEPNTVLEKGKTLEVQGLAFDGGDSITRVEISADKGSTWQDTRLDPSLGKYSWRRWRYSFTPSSEGKLELLVKATNAAGATQPWHQWNRSGYLRNEIESLPLTVR